MTDTIVNIVPHRTYDFQGIPAYQGLAFNVAAIVSLTA